MDNDEYFKIRSSTLVICFILIMIKDVKLPNSISFLEFNKKFLIFQDLWQYYLVLYGANVELVGEDLPFWTFARA